MAISKHDWALPWLRITLVIRSILGQPWDDQTWAVVKSELPKALALRTRIRRAGWFN